MSKSPEFITPDWPAPQGVRAVCSTRVGGCSQSPFDTFNVATHVGDDPQAVQQNRQLLQQTLQLAHQPVWLDQQHTDIAIQIDKNSEFKQPPISDASWTKDKEAVAVVMTADCLPVLLTTTDGSCVAAIHAGWKGLAEQIIGKTINEMPVEPENLMAWIGPAISFQQFEVGQEVFEIFSKVDKDNQVFFKPKIEPGKYLADLPAIAELQLQKLGLNKTNIYQSNLCSYENKELFYSYRRDGQSGRMASLIWRE